MANSDQDTGLANPLDEWPALSESERVELQRRGSSPPPMLEEASRLAGALEPGDQLRLMSRLWKSLPREHRTALLQFQLDEIEAESAAEVVEHHAPSALWRMLFDTAQSSRLYSAPRRFDLATIFVVTAAYSLLLGGLTALDAGPLVKIIISGLIAVVAAGQALLDGIMNPRGASVLVGGACYAAVSFFLWLMLPRFVPNGFLLIVVLNGIVFGMLVGYLCGVLVGGVFLMADMLRGKLERGTAIESDRPVEARSEVDQ